MSGFLFLSDPNQGAMYRHFRPLYRGHIIANVEMTAERANRLIAEGLVDSAAFGRPYIANPDLVERFRDGVELNSIDWPTVYASGAKGYSDYPSYVAQTSLVAQ